MTPEKYFVCQKQLSDIKQTRKLNCRVATCRKSVHFRTVVCYTENVYKLPWGCVRFFRFIQIKFSFFLCGASVTFLHSIQLCQARWSWWLCSYWGFSVFLLSVSPFHWGGRWRRRRSEPRRGWLERAGPFSLPGLSSSLTRTLLGSENKESVVLFYLQALLRCVQCVASSLAVCLAWSS